MKRFGFALAGILRCVRTERSMRVHLCFTFYVVYAGFVTGLGAGEWAAALLCCALVLGAECVNSALERLCDELTREKRPGIGAAKDMAAGAVLVCAAVSAAIGCMLFFSKGRPALALSFFSERPAIAALTALSLIGWLIFIFGRRKQ